MSADVRHEPEAKRFVADVEGGEAELRYLRPVGDVVAFVHTEVPEAAEGGGVGSALAKAALTWARAEGLRVQPLCPFVAAYIERHPEWQGLVGGAS